MIVALPAATPVAIPVDEPTVATAVLLLLHVPPVVALFSVVVAPTHAESVPVIVPAVDGAAFTVAIAVVIALPQLLVTV